MIVVDSNVLAYFYLPGAFTEAAEQLFERESDWHVCDCRSARHDPLHGL